MAKSTQIITDATTVANGTFTTTSQAKAIAATGPIQDLNGNALLVLRKYQEALNLLTTIKAGTDAGDPLLTTIQSLIDVSV